MTGPHLDHITDCNVMRRVHFSDISEETGVCLRKTSRASHISQVQQKLAFFVQVRAHNTFIFAVKMYLK